MGKFTNKILSDDIMGYIELHTTKCVLWIRYCASRYSKKPFKYDFKRHMKIKYRQVLPKISVSIEIAGCTYLFKVLGYILIISFMS